MILKNLFRTIVYTIIYIAITLRFGYNNDNIRFKTALFLFISLSFIINITVDLIISKLISKFGKTKS